MGGGFRLCFNPLDRVKFVQIPLNLDAFIQAKDPFQSPRSGQICSNAEFEAKVAAMKARVSIP